MPLKSSLILKDKLLTFTASFLLLVMEVRELNFISTESIESLISVPTKTKEMFTEFILETVFVPDSESSKTKSVQMELNSFNVIKQPYKELESMKCLNICSLVDRQVILGLIRLQPITKKSSNSWFYLL